MKHFLSKVKKATKDFFTNKSAFSLVELIVVIAIMAVMAAVLAPALLGYVEKSRMQKDDSAMDEVVNAIQLSLADQEIYDEVLEHSVWDNVSCYIDKKDESQFVNHKVTLKAEHGDKKEQYMFDDNARLLDETVYYAAGNMRGLTITFSPSESGDTYDFANGVLNKFVGRKTGLLSENPELYNRLRSVIGDKLDTTSQTYRNSDYTVFIRVGSTGGAEAVQQDAIQVWGQFNGTNLSEKDHKYELSSGRVVGSAGAKDEANNATNNSGSSTPNFSENAPEMLTMTIDGVSYQYENGMTWTDWIGSKYDENKSLVATSSSYVQPTNPDGYQVLKMAEICLFNKIESFSELINLNRDVSRSEWVLSSHQILPIDYVIGGSELPGDVTTSYAIEVITRAGRYVVYDVITQQYQAYQAPPAMLTMTIENVEYYFDEGMTWADWGKSAYCTIDNFAYEKEVSSPYRGTFVLSAAVSYWEYLENENKYLDNYLCPIKNHMKIYPIEYQYADNMTDWTGGKELIPDWPAADGYYYILKNNNLYRYTVEELQKIQELIINQH